jgi:predicted Rossmann-fold nucleotide-binding protein
MNRCRTNTSRRSCAFNFHYFGIRKMHFLLRAKAIAVFPGGFGTLDELFESLTLIQTGRMEQVPVLLFGEKFWRDVINWDALAEAGTISPDDLTCSGSSKRRRMRLP